MAGKSTIDVSTISESLASATTLLKGSSNNNGINQVCSIKLDGTNFLIWQTHVLPIIKGHKLEGFTNGTKVCPPSFIKENDVMKPNPALEDWVAADQLLFGWLLNTMSLEVSSQMVVVSTSTGLWEAAKQIARA
ncbi:hypothetical protein QN277_019055 [Acacia crassicarpa]|uniref:Retrotransposon Copia-like N-terminal domain-containing protein n=1 Tax=Acacia crassicarpa TaxID=499986 RepID=A0AAE1KKC3_9FABA|nr:hypothetical protein QN277_019055 [Acacia crassicarpa]